ncbi:MAG TPA: DUF3137 domain-containing protein [Bacteroidia bacterium]|nr:DUF3137 domain-containing protein [Bacteroidia bacterium]
MAPGGKYSSIISPEEQQLLDRLDRQRILVRRKPMLWILSSALFVSVMVVTGSIIENKKYENDAWPYVVMLVFTLFFFGCIAWLTFKFPERGEISKQYKRFVLQSFAPKILPGWVFSRSHKLKNEDIRKSGLFKDKANRMAREDYLFGPAGKVVAEVYQITLQVEPSSNKEQNGGVILKKETPTTFFFGFFYRVHCPLIFLCDVWVFPKHRKLSGEVDDWAEVTEEKYSGDDVRKPVMTSDAAFDERFSVYSNYPPEALNILNHRRRENLLTIDRMFSTSCAFSFTGNKVFIMIGFEKDPLDIDLRKTIGEDLFAGQADELLRMKEVALLASAL